MLDLEVGLDAEEVREVPVVPDVAEVWEAREVVEPRDAREMVDPREMVDEREMVDPVAEEARGRPWVGLRVPVEVTSFRVVGISAPSISVGSESRGRGRYSHSDGPR